MKHYPPRKRIKIKNKEAFLLNECIGAINKISENLEKHIEQITKMEIKDICVRLQRQVTNLKDQHVVDWIERERFEGETKMTLDADVQTTST